jgi:hypothetical protein
MRAMSGERVAFVGERLAARRAGDSNHKVTLSRAALDEGVAFIRCIR